MAMGLTKQDLKAVEMMLRELPKPEYEDLCDFIGLDAPELRILDLKYRHYTERTLVNISQKNWACQCLPLIDVRKQS